MYINNELPKIREVKKTMPFIMASNSESHDKDFNHEVESAMHRQQKPKIVGKMTHLNKMFLHTQGGNQQT